MKKSKDWATHSCGAALQYDDATETCICAKCGNITETVEVAPSQPTFLIDDPGDTNQ